jgi:hypothetical protein
MKMCEAGKGDSGPEHDSAKFLEITGSALSTVYFSSVGLDVDAALSLEFINLYGLTNQSIREQTSSSFQGSKDGKRVTGGIERLAWGGTTTEVQPVTSLALQGWPIPVGGSFVCHRTKRSENAPHNLGDVTMYRTKKNSILIGTVCVVFALCANLALAAAQQKGTRDALGFLKRALTEANAPALTTDQEAQINTLVTAYKAAQPAEPSQALLDARAAYAAAVVAGDATAAQNQAGIIAGLIAGENNMRLLALAKFGTDVSTILKNGGQLEYLVQKLSSERVLGVIESLVGHGGGGPGGGPGRR